MEPVALYAGNILAVSSSVICMRPCDLTPTVTLLFTDPVISTLPLMVCEPVNEY
jgi:hypothetical protein